MAVADDDFNDLFAAFERLSIIITTAVLFWQSYRCCYLRRGSSGSRSFTDHVLHPPAPARSPPHPLLFDLLPTSTYSSAAAAAGSDEHGQAPPECAICLEEFKEGDKGRMLPNCNHFFHLDCINDWLRTNTTCPLCREVVKPPPRIRSQHENTEASAGEGQSENSSNVNLPPPIWCPINTNTRQVIESEHVVIGIPEEDHRRSQRQSTSLRELAWFSLF